MTPDKVATLCGYSRKAIYRAIERGELRATKGCARWRILREDVARWLEEGMHVVDNELHTTGERKRPPVAL